MDGELWNLRVTSVPEPEQVDQYIFKGIEMRPSRFAFAVIDAASGEVLGTTSYHDVVPAIGRLEIGYTWYAKRCQRSHVNTTCKLLLLAHAFDKLGCALVGLGQCLRLPGFVGAVGPRERGRLDASGGAAARRRAQAARRFSCQWAFHLAGHVPFDGRGDRVGAALAGCGVAGARVAAGPAR